MTTTRIGLGCMRVFAESGVDTIRAGISEGISILDTARAYGESESMIARAAIGADVRVVTKVGMQPGWIADGRATTILDQARASRDALAPVVIDTLLLHAVDPRTPLSTSVRALMKAKEEGIARRIGLSNVTRAQLEEASTLTTIEAVEVALGAFDDASARGGVVRWCIERGVDLFAHSPLGGPKRAGRVARDPTLRVIAKSATFRKRSPAATFAESVVLRSAPNAASLDARPTAIELFLAYLAHLHACIVPIPGARTVESAKSVASAMRLSLDEETLDRIDARFPALSAIRKPPRRAPIGDREVVLVMGIPGSGKSRKAMELVGRGHHRLNRDERGGTLKQIARALDEHLANAKGDVVLDNTYVTRAARNDVVTVAHRRGARVRCVLIDAPLKEAQVNVCLRMLRKYGALLSPEEIGKASRDDANMVRPLVLHRMLRELERPSLDEGFDEVDVVPFTREPREDATRAGIAIALQRFEETSLTNVPLDVPILIYAWQPGATNDWKNQHETRFAEIARESGRTIDFDVCPHPGGPPACWCRPPLPGLWVAFAERRGVDLTKLIVVA